MSHHLSGAFVSTATLCLSCLFKTVNKIEVGIVSVCPTLMKWGLNLGWAPVMQIKKGTQNLRSWVHTTLPHHKAWVPNVRQCTERCGGCNLPISSASPGQADQQCRLVGDAKLGGTAVPSPRTATFLLEEPLGPMPWSSAMAHWASVSAISILKCLLPQNPLLYQISIPLNHIFKVAVYKASSTVFDTSPKRPRPWCAVSPCPGTCIYTGG